MKKNGSVFLRTNFTTVLEFEPGPIRSRRRLATETFVAQLLASLRRDLMDPGSNPKREFFGVKMYPSI